MVIVNITYTVELKEIDQKLNEHIEDNRNTYKNKAHSLMCLIFISLQIHVLPVILALHLKYIYTYHHQVL